MSEIHEQVCTIVAMMCDIPVEGLNSESRFGVDVIVDSLKTMMINAALMERFGDASPTYNQICNMHTIGEMADAISAKMQAK